MSQKGVAHILLLIILIAGLVAGVYLTTSGNPLKLFSKATETKTQSQIIANLTQELLLQKDKYEKAGKVGVATEKEQALSSLVSVAARRKEELLKVIEKDPQAFLNLAILVSQRDNFPKEVRAYIEEKLNITGELEVIHADNFKDKSSKYIYSLKVGGKLYSLFFANNPTQLLTGSQVEVNGLTIDSKVVLESGSDTPGMLVFKSINAASTIGEQKMAVFMVNFQENTTQPFTAQDLRSILIDQANSVNNYYKENSYNLTYFSSDIFGWYTVSGSVSDCINYNSWANEADQQALANGIDLTQYGRIMYVLAAGRECDWAGLSTVGGNPSRTWIRGNFLDRRVFEHELGHNLGLRHANSLRCLNSAVDNDNADYYYNCQETECGDYSDIMGHIELTTDSSFHFNGPHKLALRWIPKSKVQTVIQSGVYTLSPVELLGSSPSVIKIPRGENGDNYYISYRRPIGFDSELPYEITQGASIHIWNDKIIEDDKPNTDSIQTKLIDSTPQTTTDTYNRGGFYDAVLTDNYSFNDSYNKITVKQLSHDDNSVSLEIKISPIITVQLLGEWKKLTSLVKPSLRAQTAIISQGYVINIGSFEEKGLVSTVSLGRITGGKIEEWVIPSTDQQLPKMLTKYVVTELNGYIYVLGTYYQNGVLKTVTYYTQLSQDGNLDKWKEATPLPEVLSSFAVASDNWHLYIIGSNDSLINKVYSVPVNKDGGLSNWSMTTSLPSEMIDKYSIASSGRYIYASGGDIFNSFKQIVHGSQVYFTTFYADGLLGEWQKTTPLPKDLSYHTSLISNDRLFVMGGTSQYIPQKSIYVAKINSNGTLSSWEKAPDLYDTLFLDSSLIYGDSLWSLGGYAGFSHNASANVYAASLVIPSPSPSPTPRSVCTPCRADINKDGKVDQAGDFPRLQACFNKFSKDSDKDGNSCEPADINKDSKINLTDFNCLKIQLNKTCQQ